MSKSMLAGLAVLAAAFLPGSSGALAAVVPGGDATLRIEMMSPQVMVETVAMNLEAKKPKPKPKPKCHWDAATGTYICTF